MTAPIRLRRNSAHELSHWIYRTRKRKSWLIRYCRRKTRRVRTRFLNQSTSNCARCLTTDSFSSTDYPSLVYHRNSYLSASSCIPDCDSYLPDSPCTSDTYTPTSYRDTLDSTPSTTPPISPTPATPVPVAHVTSKKSSRYLNWKKTVQRKETHCPGQPSEHFSAVWTAQQLYHDKPKSALAALSIWTHRKRSKEVSHETIAELNALSDDNVILALNELKEPKKYIRGTGGQQLNLKTQIRTLDD